MLVLITVLPVASSKDSFVGFRASGELKRELEEIADQEGRSVSQVCELLIKGALDAYHKQGSPYLQRLVSMGRPRRSKRFDRE